MKGCSEMTTERGLFNCEIIELKKPVVGCVDITIRVLIGEPRMKELRLGQMCSLEYDLSEVL
jgi:hypothetical protein